MHIIIGMLPHIIIIGIPVAIIFAMASQRSFIISMEMPSAGIILQIIPSFAISQDILHIIGAAPGIMPIMGMPMPMFIIPGIIGMPMFIIPGMPMFIIPGIIGWLPGIPIIEPMGAIIWAGIIGAGIIWAGIIGAGIIGIAVVMASSLGEKFLSAWF